MEKAKISAYQLFVLIVLFELGSAMLLPLAIEAKNDAWLVVLIGMAGGMCLFLVYYGLYANYPDIPPTEYAQKIMGNVLGRMIAFLYVLYFVYLSARVVRDFGEMLVIAFYPETPLFIMNALMILVAVYAVRKGIEVLARTGELLFFLLSLLLISGLFLIVVADIMKISNLQPFLEEGMKPIIKTAFTETLYFPFGEVVAFTMILPYLNQSKKMKWTGLLALGISGVTLALITAVDISVLGVELVARSLFPLLSTIQTIEVAGFLERLDIFFMLATIIGGFFKITLYLYVSVAGTASLFKIKESDRLAYPLGVVILLLSMMIASNFTEHLKEGIDIIPLYVHLPFQVVIPVVLLIIAFLKKGKPNSRAL